MSLLTSPQQRNLKERLQTGLALILMVLLPMVYSDLFCLWVLRTGILLGAIEFAWALRLSSGGLLIAMVDLNLHHHNPF